MERYVASHDPDFESKAADIIGLYVNPPQHAAVFCVDEKTAIQALDRLDPVLPLSPGRAERHGFEYYRHGTLSLYAALNTKTGKVLGKTAARHTSAEFVAFLSDLVTHQPRQREIHIIADNLSLTKPGSWNSSWRRIRAFTFTSHRRTPPGSTTWKSGSARSNATSSRGACSRRSLISGGNSCATSAITTRSANPSNGVTPIRRAESPVPIQPLQATSVNYVVILLTHPQG
jgi:hypothetical protein